MFGRLDSGERRDHVLRGVRHSNSSRAAILFHLRQTGFARCARFFRRAPRRARAPARPASGHLLAGSFGAAQPRRTAADRSRQRFTHGSSPRPVHCSPIVRPLFAFIVLLILGKGLLGVAAGIGLLKRAAWARSLALLLAFLSLLDIPFGTVLAIYTIWVLRSSDADREYRTLASGA